MYIEGSTSGSGTEVGEKKKYPDYRLLIGTHHYRLQGGLGGGGGGAEKSKQTAESKKPEGVNIRTAPSCD